MNYTQNERFYDPLGPSPENIKSIFNGQKVTLSLKRKEYIEKDCIVTDTAFFNRFKTKENSLSAFVIPKISLRFYSTALTYADLVEKKDELEEVYQFIKSEILKHKGCLITNHGPYWKKLVVELLKENKHVYINTSYTSTDIYKCSLGHDKFVY